MVEKEANEGRAAESETNNHYVKELDRKLKTLSDERKHVQDGEAKAAGMLENDKYKGKKAIIDFGATVESSSAELSEIYQDGPEVRLDSTTGWSGGMDDIWIDTSFPNNEKFKVQNFLWKKYGAEYYKPLYPTDVQIKFKTDSSSDWQCFKDCAWVSISEGVTDDSPANELHEISTNFEATEVRIVMDRSKAKTAHPKLRFDWAVEKI